MSGWLTWCSYVETILFSLRSAVTRSIGLYVIYISFSISDYFHFSESFSEHNKLRLHEICPYFRKYVQHRHNCNYTTNWLARRQKWKRCKYNLWPFVEFFVSALTIGWCFASFPTCGEHLITKQRRADAGLSSRFVPSPASGRIISSTYSCRDSKWAYYGSGESQER